MLEKITEALANLEEDEALKLVKAALEKGTEPLAIFKACQEGMIRVGTRFEQGEYFVSDLMMSGEIFKQAAELLGPILEAEGAAAAGKVVIGTAKGDIHDIGKDIVVNMLKSANLQVIDLGVDVPQERFVEALKESGAPVLGMSGLLTLSFDSMKATIQAVEVAGLRDKVKIMVGGGPVDGNVCRIVGADGWGGDAQAAVRLCKNWMEVAR